MIKEDFMRKAERLEQFRAELEKIDRLRESNGGFVRFVREGSEACFVQIATADRGIWVEASSHRAPGLPPLRPAQDATLAVMGFAYEGPNFAMRSDSLPDETAGFVEKIFRKVYRAPADYSVKVATGEFPGGPETADMRRVRGRIGEVLRQIVAGYEVDAAGAFSFRMESTRVFVVPVPFDGEGTLVRVFAITNLDLDLSHELASYLLTANLRFPFGAFSYDAEHRAVWFEHCLLGDHMSREALRAVIQTVAALGDKLDDDIHSKFGGRRFTDAPNEMVPPPTAHVTPPGGYL